MINLNSLLNILFLSFLGPVENRPNLKFLDVSGIDARAGFLNFFKKNSQKWPLKELSVSTQRINFSSEEIFVPFIKEIVLGNSNLEILDLSRTNIDGPEILLLLRAAEKELKTINFSVNFSGCFGSPRGWRRKVHRKEFKKLIKILEGIAD